MYFKSINSLLIIIIIFVVYCNTLDNEKVLSRQRRYLIFPEGSSLQIIYDQTIPEVGDVLVFTLGITVALAWELPSKPLYKIAQEIRENYKKGEYILRRQEAMKNLTYIDSNATKLKADFAKWNKHSLYYSSNVPVQLNETKINSNINNNKNYYVDTKPIYNWVDKNYPQSTNKFNYYFNTIKNVQTNPSKYNPIDFLAKLTKNNQNNVVSSNKYSGNDRKVYPVFGKRDVADEEEKLFKNHHRSTRLELYRKIEKFLTAKGSHGEHCVLKALCETRQKRAESNEPESFVVEIMKAIFSLPQHDNKLEQKRAIETNKYHAAHQYDRNCTERYPQCMDSLWSANFIF